MPALREPGARILVVEDEGHLRKLVRMVLERAGYSVIDAANGKTGLRLFHEQRPDLVVLDVGLPDLDGWQVLERLRELSDVPVLILTARTLEAEKVRGLHSGADDYVTKPFGREELAARVHALLRRAQTERPGLTEHYVDDRLQVDFAAREVQVDGVEVSLTPTEYRLLVALVQHAGQVLGPEQLLELAWGDPTAIGVDRVKYAVMRLRRKVGMEGADSPIEAVRGFGYRYRPARTG